MLATFNRMKVAKVLTGYYVKDNREHLDNLINADFTTKEFPSYNEDVEGKTAIPSQRNHINDGKLDTRLVQPMLLGEFCPLRHIKAANENPIHITGKVFASCLAKYDKLNECALIRDLLYTCQELEKRLNNSMPFSAMGPKFVLIGSVAEGTRLKPATEIDVMCQLFYGPQHKSNHFIVDENDPFHLYADNAANHAANSFCDNDQLDYDKLLTTFLKSLKSLAKEMKEFIKETTNKRLKIGNATSFCEKCTLMAHRSKGIYFKHCENCLFPITQTKMGACLVFSWTPRPNEASINVSMDLVLALPLKKNIRGQRSKLTNVINLQHVAVQGLVKHQPPNWRKHLEGHLGKDQILPDAFEEQMAMNKPITVGLKRLHYGRENNFIIRPVQSMHVVIFEQDAILKELYQTIKYLKKMLKVDIDSYSIKKILFLDITKIFWKHEERFNWHLVENAIYATDLKKYFESASDLLQWNLKELPFVDLAIKRSHFIQKDKQDHMEKAFQPDEDIKNVISWLTKQ